MSVSGFMVWGGVVSNRRFLFGALHLFALCSFAFAQPLYDLLAQNLEFFVAHRIGAAGVILLLTAISFGLPLLLVLIEASVGLVSPRARHILHLCFVAVLAWAAILIAFNRLAELPPKAALILSLAGAVLFAAAYLRMPVVRRFCSIASGFALFFPVYVLTLTPISKIYSPPDNVTERTEVKGSIPVVVVLFDEFNLTGLLNEKQEIDAVRFPNLAALARNAWWFRRATSVYPQTTKAVPAILTGLAPTQDVVPPSVVGYPNNLFTWLGSNYKFNVAETATDLCPEQICRRDDAQSQSRLNWRLLISDLSVVYLHILLPPKHASTLLPPLDTGWNGFALGRNAQGEEEGHHTVSEGHQRRGTTRAEAFSSFVSHIEAGDKTLDFIHVLLPHSPYVYLPSGQVYPGGFEEGTLPNQIWASNDYLVRLQYQRFLQQAGYADRLIGDLVSKLKQVGKYEKALIVVTADHGKSFTSGLPKRTLSNENASEILQIPLFVKLPEQAEGFISDRPVSNLDILPTIADVLSAGIPWQVDGHSMLAKSFPERDVLEMQTRTGSEGQFRFAREKITSFPHLSWHLRSVGSGSPLESIRLSGEHSDLIGRTVSELPIESGQEKLTVSLEAFDALSRVDLQGESLPVYWRGEVIGLPENSDGAPIALALNGTIEAVVPTYTWDNKASQFSAMIPQSALRAGSNEFRAFLVRTERDKPRLIELMTSAPKSEFHVAKEADGSEAIVPSSGQRMAIVPGKVDGWVDHLKKSEFLLEISGWAAETERKLPVKEILIFAGGKFIYAGTPNAERPDVSKLFGAAGLAGSGYRFRIPLQVWGTDLSSIRVFGITDQLQASELNLSKAARAAFSGGP